MSLYKERSESRREIKSPGEIALELRQNLGFSEFRAASESSLSQGYINQIEHEKIQKFRLRTVVALAKAYGEGVHFFEGATDQKVFLTPQARKIAQILKERSGEEELTAKVINLNLSLLPKVGEQSLTYIEEDVNQSFSYTLRQLRKSKDLTQSQVALEASISQGYLAHLESKFSENPSIAILEKLAQFYQTDLENLLGLKTITVPTIVQKVDQYFRSKETPVELKKWLERLIDLLSPRSDKN